MRTHFGRRITVTNLGEYFSTAYLKAATVENAVNVLKSTLIMIKVYLPETFYMTPKRQTTHPNNAYLRLQNQKFPTLSMKRF